MLRLQNQNLAKDRQERDMVEHITNVLLHGGANDADIQEMLDQDVIDLQNITGLRNERVSLEQFAVKHPPRPIAVACHRSQNPPGAVLLYKLNALQLTWIMNRGAAKQ